jgi:GT2 family glycosyltransferase
MLEKTIVETITPLVNLRGENYYRLQGIEKYVIGSRHLFFANNTASHKQIEPSGLYLDNHEWFATGTFRNSLYIEPFSQLTSVRDLSLLLDYEGALHLKIMFATRGKPAEILNEIDLVSDERTKFLLKISSPTDLPEGARIFWHIDALVGGCTIYDAIYCTRTKPQTTRLAVLLRTFGRTTDVKSLLTRFANAGLQDPIYASILEHMEFWVLDTTAGADTEYGSEWSDALNLKVLVGPNLGGGGNAGHMLKIFDDACRESKNPPNELLILDDDLSITMESLARYFMFAAYRSQEFICSLPILMKSRPLTVWEDGGFWGRLNFHEGGNFGVKRNLFPNLLKHGTTLTGYDKLDDFGPLNTCEYSTFIFFGLSMKAFRKIGYPASFFLRGDDIELSLRAQAAGYQMITNPNLAAWHEPAHSYGQEYMAIMHGVIINLTYGEYGADFYIRFFEERMHEHASIDDLAGIQLYKDILTELLNPESVVLTADFQQHYLQKLKQLGSIKFMKIPEANRELFERRVHEEKGLLISFVHPGYQKEAKKHLNVVVVNHGAHAYRELPPCTIKEKTTLCSEYLALLARLDAEFADMRSRWQTRLETTSQVTYWNDIQKRYAGETRLIFETRFNIDSLKARLAEAEIASTEHTLFKGEISDDGNYAQLLKARLLEAEAVAEAKAKIKADLMESEAGVKAKINAALMEAETEAKAKMKAALMEAETEAKAKMKAALMEAETEAKAKMKAALMESETEAKAKTQNWFKPLKQTFSGSSHKTSKDDSGQINYAELPDDFDPDYYLAINPDVQESGKDPVQHYLRYGRKEGRQYKAL